MEPLPTLALDPSIREHNLAALRRVMPDLADRLSPLPEDYALPATTRDGRPGFRLHTEDGTRPWFGRTSIPGVRAAALVDQFQAGNGNVLLPGIGEGSEASLLLLRMGSHRAVFVWEPCERWIDLAIRLHPWHAELHSERLVFLCCPLDQLDQRLTDWLATHEGVLCPQRIMMWPWQAMADMVPIRAAVETAFQRTEQNRSSAMRALAASLARCDPDVAAGMPVAVISSRVRYDLTAMAGALAEVDPGDTPVVVRTPADVHPLVRLRRLVGPSGRMPAGVCLLEMTRSDASDVLPAGIPAVCWLGLRPRDGVEALARIEPASLQPTADGAAGTSLAVAGSWLRDRATAAGVSRDRLAVVPPAHLACADPVSTEDGDRPIEVIIAADGAPLDPVALGFSLPTHILIWNRALKRLGDTIEHFTDDQAVRLLERAEQDAANRLAEPAIRRDMLTALTLEAAGTLYWLRAIEALTQAIPDLAWQLVGQGWGSRFGTGRVVQADSAAKRAQLYQASRLFIHASPVGAVSGDCLTAAACGAVVLARRHPRDGKPGGLATLLTPDQQFIPFAGMAELCKRVGELRRGSGRRSEVASSALAACRASQGPAARLTALKTALTSLISLRPS